MGKNQNIFKKTRNLYERAIPALPGRTAFLIYSDNPMRICVKII